MFFSFTKSNTKEDKQQKIIKLNAFKQLFLELTTIESEDMKLERLKNYDISYKQSEDQVKVRMLLRLFSPAARRKALIKLKLEKCLFEYESSDEELKVHGNFDVISKWFKQEELFQLLPLFIKWGCFYARDLLRSLESSKKFSALELMNENCENIKNYNLGSLIVMLPVEDRYDAICKFGVQNIFADIDLSEHLDEKFTNIEWQRKMGNDPVLVPSTLLDKLFSQHNRRTIVLHEYFKDYVDANGFLHIKQLPESAKLINIDFGKCVIMQEKTSCFRNQFIAVNSDLSEVQFKNINFEILNLNSRLPDDLLDCQTPLDIKAIFEERDYEYYYEYKLTGGDYDNRVDRGWKLHIYCHPDDIKKAFEIIYGDLLSIHLSWKVLTHSDLELRAAGKAFTLYLPLDKKGHAIISEDDLCSYLQLISDKLTKANIRTVEALPCDVQTKYPYVTLRNCISNSGRGAYIDSKKAGNAWNPIALPNPFPYLLSEELNSEKFDVIKHFTKLPADSLESLCFSLHLTFAATVGQYSCFDIENYDPSGIKLLVNMIKAKPSNSEIRDTILFISILTAFDKFRYNSSDEQEHIKLISIFTHELNGLKTPLGDLSRAVSQRASLLFEAQINQQKDNSDDIQVPLAGDIYYDNVHRSLEDFPDNVDDWDTLCIIKKGLLCLMDNDKNELGVFTALETMGILEHNDEVAEKCLTIFLQIAFVNYDDSFRKNFMDCLKKKHPLDFLEIDKKFKEVSCLAVYEKIENKMLQLEQNKKKPQVELLQMVLATQSQNIYTPAPKTGSNIHISSSSDSDDSSDEEKSDNLYDN